MAHDDGSNSSFLTTNKQTLLYSMLTFSFDGLSVTWTYFVEFGCECYYIGHALKHFWTKD